MVRGIERTTTFRDDIDRTDFLTRLAADLGIPVAVLAGGSQVRAAVTARQLLAYVWVEVLGRRASALARAADTAHREHADRAILNTPIGHRERSAATLAVD